MDWYEAIKKLTEITGRERDTFVAGVAQRQRAVSSASKADFDSNSSEFGLDNDEADEVPYAGQVSNVGHPQEDEEILQPPVRPEGGRFPSDINVNRFANQAESVSGESNNEAMASVSAQPGAVGSFGTYDPQQAYTEDQYQAQQAQQSQQFSEEPSYAKQTALMSGAAMAGAAMSGGAQDSAYESIQPPQDTNAYSTPPDAQNSTYVAPQTEQPIYPTQSSNPALQETRGGDHVVVMAPMQTTHQREQEPLPADNVSPFSNSHSVIMLIFPSTPPTRPTRLPPARICRTWPPTASSVFLSLVLATRLPSLRTSMIPVTGPRFRKLATCADMKMFP